MDFTGKNILIVGGSSGIGLALAKQLHSDGANLIVASRQRRDLPDEIKHVKLDILEDVSTLSEHLPDELHGLVYAVGSINLKPFNRLNEQDFLQDYRINVLGAIKVLQLSLKALQAAKPSSVVLFSTVAAKTGMPYHTSVASAKKGVEGLAISLAAEFSPAGIRVNVVAPSLTDTPLAASLLNTDDKKQASAKRHPLGRYGNVTDISNAVRFLLDENSSGWMTGQVLGVDGGLSTLKPL